MNGNVVCVMCSGNYVYIPFRNEENANSISMSLWKELQKLEPGEDGHSKPRSLSFKNEEVDPTAWVRIDLIVGIYVDVAVNTAHTKAVQKMADLMEKAHDPDKDEEWKNQA